MYFVDRNNIEKKLLYMEDLNIAFPEVVKGDSQVRRLALERIAQGWIEAVVDVGNQMIDGFIMRDPGSYEDIIDILDDEKVIPSEEANALKKVIKLRKPLVQQYNGLDHTILLEVLLHNKYAIEQFPERVRLYLEEELGPVSAFLPDK